MKISTLQKLLDLVCGCVSVPMGHVLLLFLLVIFSIYQISMQSLPKIILNILNPIITYDATTAVILNITKHIKKSKSSTVRFRIARVFCERK